MELLLERFVTHFNDLYGDLPDKFKKEDGRQFFLLYLGPIINGTGLMEREITMWNPEPVIWSEQT